MHYIASELILMKEYLIIITDILFNFLIRKSFSGLVKTISTINYPNIS